MSTVDLSTDAGLRGACEEIGLTSNDPARLDWARRLTETLSWVRTASQEERATREFQQRLWEDNNVAAVGQGNISLEDAIADEGFRRWLAEVSTKPLPTSEADRLRFIENFYQSTKSRLDPFVRKTPHLKIFRVIAALYPEVMTTLGKKGGLLVLARAMGESGRLESGARHVWVRSRLDSLLGPVGQDPASLAARMMLPWFLYERYCQPPPDKQTSDPKDPDKLLPLPAVRRRRGLTAIRGLFSSLLSALEFVRDGVTREDLLDFLRAASPDVKASSLGVAINVLQSEFGVIKQEDGRYVLTERGTEVLESQDPIDLSDWVLTRVLGVDTAIVALQRGSQSPPELTAAIRACNPALASDYVPQSIMSWLRSMKVIHTNESGKLELTEDGKQWAAKIYWSPESLPAEPVVDLAVSLSTPSRGDEFRLPGLASVIVSTSAEGHFRPEVVACLHAGLWSHPRRHFAILTGLSGSGKTLMARSYGKALTDGGGDPGQVLTFPVQPGWHDPSPLLGFANPLRPESYVSTPFLEFLISAGADPTRPYVVILDEMNLSHPEQYLAPLLSAMETGDVIQLHTEGQFLDGVPAALSYPSNLVLIGTVNMDETTHGLSDKVLDRAFVLEFWEIDLDSYPRWKNPGVSVAEAARVRDVLTELMRALAPARLHFGWRVVDDVLNFLKQASASGDTLPFEAALDAVLYAKVLPKLRGEDAPRFRSALLDCEVALKRFELPLSCAKVGELRRDLEATGSARFWR